MNWRERTTRRQRVHPQSTIIQVMLEALPKFHMWTQLLISLVTIPGRTSTILQVTLEVLPKFHWRMQLKTSLVPFWPQTSTILHVTPEALPKFHIWTQFMTSLVSTTNIHDSSGYAGGAAQIPQWMQLMASLVPIWPQTSTIFQVTPEVLPKFHMWTQLMTSLIPIWQQTSTICLVIPEVLPKFRKQMI